MPEMKGISLIPAQYFAKKIDSNEINHYAGCGSKQIANRFYAVPLVISEAGALVAHIAYLAPAIILKVVTFPTKYCFSCCRSIDSNLKISATLKNTIKLVALIFCGIVFGAVISPRYNNILNKKLGLIDDPRFSLRRTDVEESNSDDDDAVGSDNHDSGSDNEGGAAAGNSRRRQADASNDASGSDNDDAGSDDEGGAAASGENAKRMGGYSAAAGNRDNDDSGEVDLLANTRPPASPEKRARSVSVAAGPSQVHLYNPDGSEVEDEESDDARSRRVSNAGGTMGPFNLDLARAQLQAEEENGASAAAAAAPAAPMPVQQATPVVIRILRKIERDGKQLEQELAAGVAAARARSASSGSDSGAVVSPPSAAGSTPVLVSEQGTPPQQLRSLAASLSSHLDTPATPASSNGPALFDGVSPLPLLSDSAANPFYSPLVDYTLSPDQPRAAAAVASPAAVRNLGEQLAAVEEEPLVPVAPPLEAAPEQGPVKDNPFLDQP